MQIYTEIYCLLLTWCKQDARPCRKALASHFLECELLEVTQYYTNTFALIFPANSNSCLCQNILWAGKRTVLVLPTSCQRVPPWNPCVFFSYEMQWGWKVETQKHCKWLLIVILISLSSDLGASCYPSAVLQWGQNRNKKLLWRKHLVPTLHPVGTSVPKALRRMKQLFSERLELLIKVYFMCISPVLFVTNTGPWVYLRDEGLLL